MLSSPTTPSFPGQGAGLDAEPLDLVVADGVRREGAGGVARVDARLLDVFHHASDEDVRPVAEGVDVDLDGVLQELVDEDRVFGRGLGVLGHPGLEAIRVVHHLHRPPAENIGGPHQHRVPEPGCDAGRLLHRAR